MTKVKSSWFANEQTWDLPGGDLDHHEQIIPALEREFEEELGVKVKVTSPAPQVYPTWNTKFDDPVLLVVYVCELDGTSSITEEVGEFDYLTSHRLMLLTWTRL